MSIGGKIVQVYHYKDDEGNPRAWVNTFDSRDYCAIIVDGTKNYRENDILWWQGSVAYWTRNKAQDMVDLTFAEKKVIRYGNSGVTHPLGKEFECKPDFYDSFKRLKDHRDELLKIVEEYQKILIPTTPLVGA